MNFKLNAKNGKTRIFFLFVLTSRSYIEGRMGIDMGHQWTVKISLKITTKQNCTQTNTSRISNLNAFSCDLNASSSWVHAWEVQFLHVQEIKLKLRSQICKHLYYYVMKIRLLYVTGSDMCSTRSKHWDITMAEHKCPSPDICVCSKA